MSKTTTELPFTEIVERAALISRSTEPTSESRVRGAVNDYYCRVLPAREDWSFLLSSSAITTEPQYNTGTASVNTQATAVTFSSDVVLPTNVVGFRLKFSSNPNVYEITARGSATDATISPPLSGDDNISIGGYVLYQPFYALAGDFDRFPKNGGLQLVLGGQLTPIKEYRLQDYYSDFLAQPGQPGRCRIVSIGTSDVPHVELIPPPRDRLVMPYEYLRSLKPLFETTAGFVDITSSISATATTSVVIGSAGTTRFTEADTGWYVRVDAFGTGEDSEWYRATNIATNSSMTIMAFGLSGATTAAYTCSAIPQMPAKMHPAILYGAVKMLLTDQNDPTFQYYDKLERELMTESLKQYKTRIYDQEIDTIATEWQYRR